MSGAKMGILASYLALALVAVLVSGQAASYAMWVLGILALAHLVEVVVFYRRLYIQCYINESQYVYNVNNINIIISLLLTNDPHTKETVVILIGFCT